MALSDGIAGGLISAGSNLIGGIFNAFGQSSANKQNLKIARENNAANQQLQATQNAWNLQQWNRENAYNSASAQKQRLLDAGLNPTLALNQIASPMYSGTCFNPERLFNPTLLIINSKPILI